MWFAGSKDSISNLKSYSPSHLSCKYERTVCRGIHKTGWGCAKGKQGRVCEEEEEWWWHWHWGCEHDDVKGKGSLYLVFLCIKANSTSWKGMEMFVVVMSCETQSEGRRYYTSSLHPHFNNVTLPWSWPSKHEEWHDDRMAWPAASGLEIKVISLEGEGCVREFLF